MTSLVPSRLRTVRIDRERAPMRSRGLVGPTTRYRLPDQNPLDRQWSWIDATAWCEDISDVIGQVGWQIIGGDGALSVVQPAILRDPPYSSLFAGARITGGTIGQTYLLRARLTALNTGEQRTVDVQLPIAAGGPVQPILPTQATVNGDALIVGGIPIHVS